MTRAAQQSALAVVLAFSAALACAQGGGETTATDGTEQPKSSGFSLGGLLGRVTNTVNQLVGGKREKAQIADLTPGAYVPSNEAIGEDRDISQQRVQKEFGFVQSPELSGYASRILETLKLASGVTDIPGKVLIAARSDLDAGSTPDGNIMVSIGWLNNMESEDELAALLAHELAHILLRHHDTDAISKAQKQVQNLLVMGIQTQAELNRLSGRAGSTTLTPQQQDVLLRLEVLVRLTDGALHPAWNRRQEYEADRLGIDLLNKAGYSYSNGYKRWLEKIRKWDEDQNAKAQEKQQQVQQLTDTLIRSGKIDQGIGYGLSSAFSQLTQELGRTHDSGEKRLDDAQDYVDTIYPDLPKRSARAVEFERIRSQGATGRMLMEYRQTLDARAALDRGDPDAAIKQLQPVLARGAIATHALPNVLMYMALKEKKRDREALTYLNRSFNAPEPAWMSFELAAEHYRASDPSQVPRIAETAMNRFNKAPALYPKMIGMYAQVGQFETMQQLQSECALSHVQYRDACNQAAQHRK